MKRWAGLTVAVLAALFALHVQLNLGGSQRFASRALHGEAARADLPVGFQPVT